jgi:methyl-accepting chemotaxis protein
VTETNMPLRSLRLGRTIAGAILALVALSGLTLVVSDRQNHKSLQKVVELQHSTRQGDLLLRQLIVLQKDVELSIVGVQESLTDVSATQGRDGLDDGFKLAEDEAARLHANVGAVKALADKLQAPELVPSFQTLQTRFDAFHQAGIAMAKAYVAGGPAKGNAMMGGFDEVADALQKEVEATGKIVAAVQTRMDDQHAAALSDAEDGAANVRMTVTAMGLASVLCGFGVCWFVSRRLLKPLSEATLAMNTLAKGRMDVSLAGTERGDEIGDLARAFATFHQNLLDKMRAEEEAAVNRSLSEQERLERERRQAEEAAEVAFAVEKLGHALGRLADGKLDYRIGDAFAERLDPVRVDFNNAVARLEDAIRRVGENAQAIAAGSNQIRAAADDLSRRTEQQAASVEETAAALEQITTTVSDSSRRADEAGQLVKNTRDYAERSGKVVGRAVEAMHAIEASSNEISSIIGVIDEIAFQTNLLALNAGVEAARAGEAGKGFAVVAQEVRELAQRSAQAAKEIKSLIGKSGQQVKSGVDLVTETGASLRHIVSQVQAVSNNVAAIVEGSREQATGLREINAAVNTMDQSTQQNAAMVEESTAASHSLAREADSLFDLVSQFSFGSAGVTDTPRLRRPASVAQPSAAPVASPARNMMAKLNKAFVGKTTNTATAWKEF